MNPKSLYVRGEYNVTDDDTREVYFRTGYSYLAEAAIPLLHMAFGIGVASAAMGWPQDPDAPVVAFSVVKQAARSYTVIVSMRFNPRLNLALLGGLDDLFTADRIVTAMRRAMTLGAKSYLDNIVEQLVGQDRGGHSPPAG